MCKKLPLKNTLFCILKFQTLADFKTRKGLKTTP